jgi:hypothetical protein
MPRKGRPRLVSGKASATKLFVDDLREIIKLAQAEGHGTISDVIRNLVHEALAYRRVRAMQRNAAEEPLHSIHQQAAYAGVGALESDLKEIKEALGKLGADGPHKTDPARENPNRIYLLLTEIIGFAMTAEMKTHLLLQNFLLSRGLSEEAARKLIAEHEEKSRQNTEKIIVGLMLSQS